MLGVSVDMPQRTNEFFEQNLAAALSGEAGSAEFSGINKAANAD